MDEEQFLTVYFAVVAGLFGAAIGSFLNVVIYRLPAGQSVVRPRSHCRCGAAIAWYDNIPVLSWFVLRGRCRHCRERFSFRYPLVEAATAALFVGLWLVGGWPVGVVWMVFAGLMIPAALIDLDTMEIPDVFSIGGFMVGILASAIVPALHGEAVSGIAIVDSMRGLTAGLLGAFVGSAMVLWVALCAEVVLRKEAMGFGDVKLMGAIGAFCGWQGAVFAFFGGAVLGLLMLIVAWPWLRNSKGAEGATEDSVAGRIPFGPSLAAAAVLYLLWFQPYVDGYFANIHELLQSF